MAGELKDPDDLRPVYLRMADQLRDAYTPGGQLPSAPKLAEEWGVARETARSAIDVLRHEGLVVAWQGRGTFYRVRPEEASEVADEDAVLTRLDQIMSRLDEFEGRLSALEHTQGDEAAQ